jgi:hypothetical protein
VIARVLRYSFVPALLFFVAADAFGQADINGRVLDAQDKPVAGLEVLLHAVNETTGSDVDKATTAEDGTFKLSAPTTDESAVYFVAVTWEGQLFMGDLLRPPFPSDQEYVVRVGVNPVDLSGVTDAPPVSPEEQKQERSAGAVVIVAAGAVIATLLGYGLHRRPASQRRWLVELARIEDDIAADPDSSVLQKRRAELRARLKAPKSG